MSYEKHMAAIVSGEVTKTNIIGIRKALNANSRRERGYSIGRCSPQLTFEQCDELLSAIHKYQPRVVGELHDGGIAVLRNKRYAKQLAAYAPLIATVVYFRLVDWQEWKDGYWTPVWEAVSPDKSFHFVNVPWQSGGNGPEIVY
jgi:hypothetical protein